MSYHADLFKLARENDLFRRELFTTERSQLVLMSLKPGEDIGLETHDLDQVLVIVEGEGECVLGGHECDVASGHVVFVPAGVQHNITNTGEKSLKLFTVYAPPEHAPGTVHKTKAEAEAAEAAEHGHAAPAGAGARGGAGWTIGSLKGVPQEG